MMRYLVALLSLAAGCDKRGGDVVGLPLADACGLSTPPPKPSATEFVNQTTPPGAATIYYDVDDDIQYPQIVEAVARYGDAVVAEGYDISTPDLCTAYKDVALQGFGFVSVDRESPLCQEHTVYDNLCGFYVRGNETYVGFPVVVNDDLLVDFMLMCGPDGEMMFNSEVRGHVHIATPYLLIEGVPVSGTERYLCDSI